MFLSAHVKLWTESVVIAAAVCLGVFSYVSAEQVPGVSPDPMTGAERGPVATDGTRSVWRQVNTDAGGGQLIIYKDANPQESLVLATGHWYLNPTVNSGHVMWMQTSNACFDGVHLCTPINAQWESVTYSLLTRTAYVGGQTATVVIPPVPLPPASLPVTVNTSGEVLRPAVLVGADTDGDGVLDTSETILFFTNPLARDSDGDGLDDYRELYLYKTDPSKFDTDGDGLHDGLEVRNNTNPFVNGTGFFSSTWYEWSATPRPEWVHH